MIKIERYRDKKKIVFDYENNQQHSVLVSDDELIELLEVLQAEVLAEPKEPGKQGFDIYEANWRLCYSKQSDDMAQQIQALTQRIEKLEGRTFDIESDHTIYGGLIKFGEGKG